MEHITTKNIRSTSRYLLNNIRKINHGGIQIRDQKKGIGRENSRVFALHGANVFVVGRDMVKGNKAVEELKKSTGKNNIFAMECDLASFDSIRNFANKFKELNKPLHYLILNAGVMACPHSKTKDGFENQFGTNFLGHFLLTNLLIPSLLAGAPARVVSVTSAGHAMSAIRWDDYNFEKEEYHKWLAYGQSKTGNILLAVELNRLYKDKGITAISIHPGGIFETELGRHSTPEEFLPENMAKVPNIQDVMKFGVTQLKNIPQGAATTMYAALSNDCAEGGMFCFDCHAADPMPHASDPESAKRLWALATKLVGL